MNEATLFLMKPELSLMLFLFILLIGKVGDWFKTNESVMNLVHGLLVVQLGICLIPGTGEAFSGMYRTHTLIGFEKLILTAGTLLISLQSWHWARNHKHLPEFYILLFTTLLGFYFMLSSGNFLMFYLALELASIPLAALVNFDLDKAKSSEAAVKMILISAFASSMMLFGISFVYGTTGSLQFDQLPQLINGGQLQMMALIFIFSGFAFKLSAVPFHLWTADVYEGAPVAVTAYLSVISKAATVFVFISILSPLFQFFPALWNHLLEWVIVLTICVGNLFALRQTNIKRFLAFSSIAQVGFILLAFVAGNADGSASGIFFLVVYLFSNLGAFGVVSIVSAQTGHEDLVHYKGFYRHHKTLGWVMALSLFSLAGVPPTAGFFGKMFLVASGAAAGNYFLLLIAALNMVVSLYYYLRIVKFMFVDEQEHHMILQPAHYTVMLALFICMAGVLLTGVVPGLYAYIQSLL
ncbi:MAG: NADH-quinone oxidoreductase subunit N [Bacteroidia bacterium]|jgi:NADH-quinone oxidoreductase subunit N